VQVLSPVGAFPLRLVGARMKSGALVIEAAMGAWKSEIRLERSDLPLAGAAVAVLALAFAWGRASSRKR